MISKHQLCLADDQVMIRTALRLLLERERGLQVVAEASHGVELLNQVKRHHPRLVITELSLPRMGGLEAIQAIRQSVPSVSILVLTAHHAREYRQAALDAGAQGYLTKNAPIENLVRAIRCVLAGESYWSTKEVGILDTAGDTQSSGMGSRS